MNIRFGNKQNLTELAEDLEKVCEHHAQPAPFNWEKIRQLLEDNMVYLRTYIIPRTPDEEPGYKSGNVKNVIAEFVPPSRDVELKPEDSSAGTPFLATNGATP